MTFPLPHESAVSNTTVSNVDVLLVEDDAGLREATQELIEMFGHSAVAVGSVQEARALLASQRFRTLVTDVRLGDESGVSLAREAGERHPSLFIIVMSGKELPDDGPTLPSTAVFLRKPYELGEFAALLA